MSHDSTSSRFRHRTPPPTSNRSFNKSTSVESNIVTVNKNANLDEINICGVIADEDGGSAPRKNNDSYSKFGHG